MKVSSIISHSGHITKYYKTSASYNNVTNISFKKKVIEKPEIIFGGVLATLFNPIVGLGIFLTAILIDTINNNDNNKNNKNSKNRNKNAISNRYNYFKG